MPKALFLCTIIEIMNAVNDENRCLITSGLTRQQVNHNDQTNRLQFGYCCMGQRIII